MSIMVCRWTQLRLSQLYPVYSCSQCVVIKWLYTLVWKLVSLDGGVNCAWRFRPFCTHIVHDCLPMCLPSSLLQPFLIPPVVRQSCLWQLVHTHTWLVKRANKAWLPTNVPPLKQFQHLPIFVSKKWCKKYTPHLFVTHTRYIPRISCVKQHIREFNLVVSINERSCTRQAATHRAVYWTIGTINNNQANNQMHIRGNDKENPA